MKSVLLDTNVVSELFKNNPQVAERLSAVERIVISPVVEGELLSGFRKGQRLLQNLAIWETFLREPFVARVSIGSETADRYSRIWNQLRLNGTPIPSNDIWIAAQATELGHELWSFDQHFTKVEGLVWSKFEYPPDP
jgi:tRNA(fMet)-specific endonuclease VapC